MAKGHTGATQRTAPLAATITSTKHGKKEPQSFSHCGSFDHPDLQSVNDCKFVFFGFMSAI